MGHFESSLFDPGEFFGKTTGVCLFCLSNVLFFDNIQTQITFWIFIQDVEFSLSSLKTYFSQFFQIVIVDNFDFVNGFLDLNLEKLLR